LRARTGARPTKIRRGVAAAAGVGLAGLLAAYAGPAGAAPQPSVSEVRQQVNSLQAKVDATGQQYDRAAQQLSSARQQLAQVQRASARDYTQYLAARTKVAQIAASAYENAGQESAAGLLSSNDPSVVLNSASLLLQMAGSRNAETNAFLADARQLAGVQQQLQHTEYGIATLKAQLAARKNSIGKMLASKQAVLDSLTAPQQAVVTASGVGAGGTTSGGYTGPTSTQAEKAVAFAYAQLGKPYQWGATGPYSYDCSGLAQAAWAAAGVAIPRDTYQQWAALPHLATSAIQPGDLLYYEGVGHVAMYVGNGYVIDAPQTGMNVQKLPMGTSWYLATYVGAVRP
jgi:cell wall-associated NlpC family hydrolase